jgi:dipeptidyl aminopeptidase/acylaminoacyl peptidase
MLGKTLLGERVGEALCLIDIVKKLPSLNTDRIVMTGNSGGGTTSLYAAAISDRVDAIMISGSFCGFRESIMELSHCECNYVPGLFHVIDEIWELGALVSPRPFLVIHGEQDAIFPIASVRDQAERVRRLYELGGVPSHFEIATHADGHRYDHGHVFSFLEEQVWK